MSDQIFDLDGMSPEEVARATAEGRLDVLLRGDRIEIAQEKAIAEREAIEREAEEAKATSVDQGARGTGREPKYDAAWVAQATPEAIARATRQGKLNDLLAGR